MRHLKLSLIGLMACLLLNASTLEKNLQIETLVTCTENLANAQYIIAVVELDKEKTKYQGLVIEKITGQETAVIKYQDRVNAHHAQEITYYQDFGTSQAKFSLNIRTSGLVSAMFKEKDKKSPHFFKKLDCEFNSTIELP